MIRPVTLKPENLISEELLSLFPNAVVKDEYGNVDFEESVFNLSFDAMYKLSESKEKKIFGTNFESQEDMYDWIINNLNSLHEIMIEKFEK